MPFMQGLNQMPTFCGSTTHATPTSSPICSAPHQTHCSAPLCSQCDPSLKCTLSRLSLKVGLSLDCPEPKPSGSPHPRDKGHHVLRLPGAVRPGGKPGARGAMFTRIDSSSHPCAARISPRMFNTLPRLGSDFFTALPPRSENVPRGMAHALAAVLPSQWGFKLISRE